MGQGKHAISYDETLKLTEAVSDVHGVLEHDSPSKSAFANRTLIAHRPAGIGRQFMCV